MGDAALSQTAADGETCLTCTDDDADDPCARVSQGDGTKAYYESGYSATGTTDVEYFAESWITHPEGMSVYYQCVGSACPKGHWWDEGGGNTFYAKAEGFGEVRGLPPF